MRMTWRAFMVAILLASPATQAHGLAKTPPRASLPPTPLAGLHSYFSTEDYPLAALRDDHQGTVIAQLVIGTDGRVKQCLVHRSSGHSELDSATCQVLSERARFAPATDRQGNPVEETITTPPITWRLPARPEGPDLAKLTPDEQCSFLTKDTSAYNETNAMGRLTASVDCPSRRVTIHWAITGVEGVDPDYLAPVLEELNKSTCDDEISNLFRAGWSVHLALVFSQSGQRLDVPVKCTESPVGERAP